MVAHPDKREDYKARDAPREPAVADEDAEEGDEDYYVNPEDSVLGFIVNGTLPVGEAQGVHSLTDVPVFAMGPCQELFGGVYNNIDIFYKIAECYGLGESEEGGDGGYEEGSDGEEGGDYSSEGDAETETETETPSGSDDAAESEDVDEGQGQKRSRARRSM